MTQLVLESFVDADGMLTLSIPIGKEEANSKVRVTVEHLGSGVTDANARKARIRALIGAWQGDFEPIRDLPPEPLEALP